MNVLFQTLQRQLSATLSPLTDKQTQAYPAAAPQRWTVQQIAEHLLLTYRATSTAIEDCIAKRRPTLKSPTLPQRLAQLTTLTWGLYPAVAKAPPDYLPTRPSSLRTGAELSFRLHADLIRLDALITKAESLFAQRRAVTHPTLGPLSGAQWRRFHLLHGLHHLKQIRRIIL